MNTNFLRIDIILHYFPLENCHQSKPRLAAAVKHLVRELSLPTLDREKHKVQKLYVSPHGEHSKRSTSRLSLLYNVLH